METGKPKPSNNKEIFKRLWANVWIKCILFCLLGFIIGRLSLSSRVSSLTSEVLDSSSKLNNASSENKKLTDENTFLQDKVNKAKPFLDLNSDLQDKVKKYAADEKKKEDEALKKAEDEKKKASENQKKAEEETNKVNNTSVDIDISNSPAGQSVKEFFTGWKEKNYDKMVSSSQKSFISRQNNPKELLESQYGFKDLKDFHIIKIYEKSSNATEVTVKVTYNLGDTKQEKTIVANVVNEDDWGVNPVSTLKEN